MRITQLGAHVVWVSHERSWLFVEVRTDQGLVGLGEASQSRNDAGVIAEIDRLAPQYIGEDPLDLIERRHALLGWPYVGRTLFAAVSALEQALWDLCGKRLGVPVYRLLGGRVRDRVRGYANIGYAAAGSNPEALAEAARSAVAEGYDAIKFYPFGMRPGTGADAKEHRRWISEGVESVRAVRNAVGDEVDILVDLMHQFADCKEARSIAKLLEPCNLYWIEDPFVNEHPQQLAEFRSTTGCRLAGGAPTLSRDSWRALLEARAFDVIMPDVKWCGGMNELKKVAAMAEAFGVLVSPHNASGPIASAASVQVSLAISNFVLLEHAWRVPHWRAALCRDSERIEGGYFTVADTPGLGIEFDVGVATQFRHPPDSDPARAGIRLPLN